MSQLGEHFPNFVLQQVADERLQAGQILKVDIDFADDTRTKYVVLAARSDPALVLIINTDIPKRYQIRERECLDCQLLLKASQYECLDYDSWLDCSNLVEVEESRIAYQILAIPDRDIVGRLSKATANEVLKRVRKSRRISDWDKELLVAALKR